MDRTSIFGPSLERLVIPRAYVAPLLITGVLLAAHLSFGILDGWRFLVVAVGTSLIAEALLHRVVVGKWRNLSSAYISGISIGILVRTPIYWPFAFGALVSIMSKYVLRYRGRHLWNPSNFGIVMVILLASDSAAILTIQWGSQVWAIFVIWMIGFWALWKVKRFHISAVYVCTFLLFAWVRSLITGDPFLAEVAPLTGPMYQLFVLFMITDPKTTVSSWRGRCLVAFLIGVVEFVFRLFEAIYAPFYALFIVGPIAMFWEQRLKDREASTDNNQEQQLGRRQELSEAQ